MITWGSASIASPQACAPPCCFAHLPPQSCQHSVESLPETAVGTGHKAVRSRIRELPDETNVAVAAILYLPRN